MGIVRVVIRAILSLVLLVLLLLVSTFLTVTGLLELLVPIASVDIISKMEVVNLSMCFVPLMTHILELVIVVFPGMSSRMADASCLRWELTPSVLTIPTVSVLRALLAMLWCSTFASRLTRTVWSSITLGILATVVRTDSLRRDRLVCDYNTFIISKNHEYS